MPSRADYLCATCHDSGDMPEPVELPTLSKVCPICAQPNLERVWLTAPAAIMKAGAEAIPRMTREQIRNLDALVAPTLERNQQQRAPHDFSARAVPMGGVNAEMSKLAGGGVVMPLQNGKATLAGSANAPGTPGGAIRRPQRQTMVAGKWNPTPAEIKAAQS